MLESPIASTRRTNDGEGLFSGAWVGGTIIKLAKKGEKEGKAVGVEKCTLCIDAFGMRTQRARTRLRPPIAPAAGGARRAQLHLVTSQYQRLYMQSVWMVGPSLHHTTLKSGNVTHLE